MDVSPEGEVVCVSAERSNHGIQGVKIQVKDGGKGMSEQEIADILAGKGSKKSGGQGLGLLSAKWIAETHNGQLTIASKQGLGTTITVTIPDNGGESSPAKTSS
ncbi:MAG: ATP-binding protein [bacterium]|nr:ATP-binding protein [bacterium]